MIDELGETVDGKGVLDGKLNRAYVWVSDTVDGGGVSWLNEGKGEGLEGRYWKGRDSGLVKDGMLRGDGNDRKRDGKAEMEESLRCRCHCGSNDFEIRKPER